MRIKIINTSRAVARRIGTILSTSLPMAGANGLRTR